MTTETLMTEWADFVVGLALKPAMAIRGDEFIHRKVTWRIDPTVFFDGSMTLENSGYTDAKEKMLQRNYYNADSIARAKADLRRRIHRKKQGSGAFNFFGIPKTGTKQDFCMQVGVIDYFPKLGTSVHIFWRTAELIKRLRGDILFLRDFILPHFKEEFEAAPLFRVDFLFANATVHPMMMPFLVQHLDNWRADFKEIKADNPKLFQKTMDWTWQYLVDPTGIRNYANGMKTRRRLRQCTSTEKLNELRRFTERHVQLDLDDYPDRVRQFYQRRRAA